MTTLNGEVKTPASNHDQPQKSIDVSKFVWRKQQPHDDEANVQQNANRQPTQKNG